MILTLALKYCSAVKLVEWELQRLTMLLGMGIS